MVLVVLYYYKVWRFSIFLSCMVVGESSRGALLTRAAEVQKTRPRTITRGPKSYLSAHRDPQNKKEFDNATETLTRAALRPE